MRQKDYGKMKGTTKATAKTGESLLFIVALRSLCVFYAILFVVSSVVFAVHQKW